MNSLGNYAFHITDKIIHGNSFAIYIPEIEFLTWKQNNETDEYWLKFHTPSSKEIRIKVSLEHLNLILGEWAILKGNDIYPNVNGDDNELENQ
tara:strand:- start:3931 stop:4209 length:279 start_codon:yes stop_codon:yes gene_type:complete